MKKIELILIGLAVLALCMKLVSLPGSSLFITIVFITWACYYPGVEYIKSMKKKKNPSQEEEQPAENSEQKQGLDTLFASKGMSLFSETLSNYIPAIVIVGVLFKLMLWPNINTMLIIGTGSAVFLLFIAFLGYLKTKSKNYFNILIRAALFSVIGFLGMCGIFVQ